jgi:hypothetical protein
MFPDYELRSDYAHPDLTGRLEYDIFIPSLSLAFEYHGVQHCIQLIAFPAYIL